MNDEYVGRRIIRMIVGSIILGFGIALAICSTQGGDAISVFSEGVSILIGTSIGNATVLFYFIWIPLAFIFYREQLGIGTIASPVIASITLDATILYGWQTLYALPHLVAMGLGIVCIGIGLGVYVSANMGRSSYDAIIGGLSNKLGIPIWLSKSGCDVILCVIGFLLGGTVGLGPISGIICIGPVLQFTLQTITKKDRKTITT
ncbi:MULTISPECIES: hypothetical protein [unclassified Breznakia]|uniref:YczE/YyaS/YitT family protein n=1 Tax=unclassified Breznakia TaxID=2623764 RepID=UPI002476CECF|nr:MULTISPECIES: hypothetical protein [unclassified Breznakia]MDH6366099.1 putative membrane protein YczE [Breznakia sp. PH1-1]MDH6402969.1 putative membrane protein YczE [Breznakia sp. PF1-11]MDH6410678.1 putative membrane protein YczE [Breznakia sp. PFB1-11]MDH6413265.1 putative membrane protein YczE [Breznakia sp. PFB1-14]MDH6415633.1 putative membrane protein YczE [Breznakia sp. PFB1-4]